jgi:hypothetical protein
MIPIHINKVLRVQKEFVKDLQMQRENAILKLKALKPNTQDDSVYLNAVIKLFVDNTDIITWNPSKLDTEKYKFQKVPTITNDSAKTVKSSIKDKILIALGYKNLRKSFYPKYFREIEIKSCVYCNSQLTITAKKPNKKGFSAKFDVDHYRSKDEFPFLSICLFNLYPSCASCNRSKSKNDNIHFDLYVTDLAKTQISEYRFHIKSHAKAKYLINKNPSFLSFTFTEPIYLPGKKEFKEVFHIEGIYETQLDVIEDLIIKSQMYNTSYLQLLKNNFDKLGLNPELFKRSLIGGHVKDEDIHKRPMNKFIMDIAKDLGLID